MGDRCSVSFKLGGKITKFCAEQLIERMKDEGLRCDDHSPALDNLDENFWADEVNYGTIESVTDYCEEHGIAYELWNDAGGGYGAGLVRFDGERREQCPSDNENGPLYPLAEIMKLETLATCLADVLALAKFMCGPFPNVEIVP